MKSILFLNLLVFFCRIAQAASCESIDVRLHGLADADQKIRHEWNQMQQNAKATQLQREAAQLRWHGVDNENLKQLREIIAVCGWPKGREASHNAWLLAQHADSDVVFQRRAKELLEASVRVGIAAPRDLAYLADRIATNEGRPQEYGTQFMQTDRCHLTMLPVDNIGLVNHRRAAIGLPSLEAYESERRKRFIAADCSSDVD